jgi:hypothetical protein
MNAEYVKYAPTQVEWCRGIMLHFFGFVKLFFHGFGSRTLGEANCFQTAPQLFQLINCLGMDEGDQVGRTGKRKRGNARQMVDLTEDDGITQLQGVGEEIRGKAKADSTRRKSSMLPLFRISHQST